MPTILRRRARTRAHVLGPPPVPTNLGCTRSPCNVFQACLWALGHCEPGSRLLTAPPAAGEMASLRGGLSSSVLPQAIRPQTVAHEL